MATVEPKYYNPPFLNSSTNAMVVGDPNQRDLYYVPPPTDIERLAERIEVCPNLPWGHMNCNTCETQLTTKPFKQCCLSNFCKYPECSKTRIRIRSMKLGDYHIHSKKLYHFVLGFSAIDINDLDKKTRLRYHRTFKRVLKKLEEQYGEFYYLSVRDLNKTKKGKVRLHYHIATLPLKDFRKFTSLLSAICKKIEGIAPSYKGYQKKSSVLSYFSKRASGEFGHNRKDERKFGFVDIMNLEQYYNVFFRTKTFNSNFSFRTRKRSEFIRMLNNIPKHCPKCEIETKNNIHFVVLEEVEHRPPDIIIKSEPLGEIEIIKIPTIKSGGI